MDSFGRLAALAMNRIEDGALSTGTVDDLAADIGISSRHLRRVIESQYGVSPIELAQTHRLLMAKQLLTDSNLPLTEVALASGFASLRRFNALFSERYRMNPSELRKSGRAKDFVDADAIVCHLGYRAPYDWDSILTFLAGRACADVELVRDGMYLRTVEIGKHAGWLSVQPCNNKNVIAVHISHSLAPVLLNVIARVKRLFDLEANPMLVESQLGELAEGAPGLRVAGAFDGLEVAVRAILGQQVSVKAASSLAGRLAALLGRKIETPWDDVFLLSPTAEALAGASVEQITSLGIISSRAASIIELAKAVQKGELRLEPGMDLEATHAKLQSIPGIGEWTAEYIAMRCLAWPDAFPHSDLGIKKALGTTSKREILEASEQWRPWRSYAAMHLWKTLEKVK